MRENKRRFQIHQAYPMSFSKQKKNRSEEPAITIFSGKSPPTKHNMVKLTQPKKRNPLGNSNS